MGQIIGGAAKPKRCNINQLSQLSTPAAGEHILVSSDNSMNAAGQGNFNSYIIGDGETDAVLLQQHTIKNNSIYFIRPFVKVIRGVRAGATIASENGTSLRYFYVEKGDVIKLTPTFESGYLRTGFTASEPAVNMSTIDSIAAGYADASGVEKIYIAPINGYFCFSFPTVGTFIALTTNHEDDGLEDNSVEYRLINGTDTSNVLSYKYINFSTGNLISGSTYYNFRAYYFPVNTINKIKATLCFSDTVPAAIAFYSSDIDVSADGVIGTYIPSKSVQAIVGTNEYEVEVPKEAKYVVISNRGLTFPTCKIELYEAPFLKEQAIQNIADTASDNAVSNSLEDYIAPEVTSILGLSVAASITSDSSSTLRYFPVLKGDVIKLTPTFASSYLKGGFTTSLPASNVSVVDYVAIGYADASGEEILYIAPLSGYFCFSLPNAGTSVVLLTNHGIGSSVRLLQGEAMRYNVIDGTDTENVLPNKYIAYSTGKMTTGGSFNSFTSYYFPVGTIKRVKAILGFEDTVPAAIAFYSSNIDVSTDGDIGTYISSESVQAKIGKNEYNIDVPSTAKYIVITNRGTTCPTCKIELYEADIVDEETIYTIAEEAVDAALAESLDSVIKIARQGFSINNFSNAPHYYHFAANSFILDGNSRKAIASESLADIVLAARLGFKFIEANIQITADNKYICIHGDSGRTFGTECKSADESEISTSELQSTVISTKTLQWIQNYVRYNVDSTYYGKNGTTIPTLEEFCRCCRENNIGLLAGVYDSDSEDICINYMGNNLILYNPSNTIRNKFNGYVLYWLNGSSVTRTQILNTAKTYGAPCIISIGPSTISALKTSDELDNTIYEMHENGFLIGFAGVYQSEEECLDLLRRGMDFDGSGWMVNPFEHNYEIFDIEGNAPTTTGTLNNGVLSLTEGQTITCGNNTIISVGKAMLTLIFNGSLNVNFGSHGSRSITSNGKETVVISDYFFGRNTELIATATASTVVSHFVYKTSKC